VGYSLELIMTKRIYDLFLNMFDIQISDIKFSLSLFKKKFKKIKIFDFEIL